jgi:hypothetical protein
MNLQEIKENINEIKKIEESLPLLLENLQENKSNRFSILNMITFSFIGWLASSFVVGGFFHFPLILSLISLTIWVYLSNTDKDIGDGAFKRYIGNKYKKITNSKSFVDIYQSNLNEKEKKLLNEIFLVNKGKSKFILEDLIISAIDRNYAEKNLNELFDLIKMIEFENKEDKERFKSKLADVLLFDMSTVSKLSFEDMKNEVESDIINKNIKIKKSKKEIRMILKSI